MPAGRLSLIVIGPLAPASPILLANATISPSPTGGRFVGAALEVSCHHGEQPSHVPAARAGTAPARIVTTPAARMERMVLLIKRTAITPCPSRSHWPYETSSPRMPS